MDDQMPVTPAAPVLATPGPHDLATQLVAKLCHDFISPTGAIVSGLDLMDDPQAQDMRDEALKLIAASSKKLVALVHFSRIAFGAATSAESFSARELNKVLGDMFESLRAQLVFDIAEETIFDKPAARALLNLGLLIGNSLPMGGTARLTLTADGPDRVLTGEGNGPRARFKPEALEGLAGQALGEGLSGQWIQPFWLFSTVSEAGGQLSVDADTDKIRVCARLPLPVATIQV